MSCTNPILAVSLFKSSDGKKHIKILPRRVDTGIEYYEQKFGKENILKLPCRKCASCLSRNSKEWAVRCCLESTLWQQNCFVTLTYDPEHYESRDLRSDITGFIKAIRNLGYQIRYYACCERGDQFGRYHFHAVLFNFFPSDAKPWAKSQSGFQQYTSKILDSCWNKGLLTVSEFHPFNAQYVAGYVVKKLLTGDKESFHIQSTKPGIGAGYFLQHIEDIYDTDNLILSFGSHRFSVPRYFDKIAESLDLDLTDIKEKRIEQAALVGSQAIRELGASCEDELLVHNDDVSSRSYSRKRRLF